MFNDVLAAIKTAFDADTTLSAAATGGFHLAYAPEDADAPFVVATWVADDMNYAMGTAEYHEAMLQFSVYSADESPSEAMSVFDALVSCFDEASLTITGHSCVRMWRVANRLLPEPGAETGIGGWQAQADYMLWFDAT